MQQTNDVGWEYENIPTTDYMMLIFQLVKHLVCKRWVTLSYFITSDMKIETCTNKFIHVLNLIDNMPFVYTKEDKSII